MCDIEKVYHVHTNLTSYPTLIRGEGVVNGISYVENRLSLENIRQFAINRNRDRICVTPIVNHSKLLAHRGHEIYIAFCIETCIDIYPS